MKKPKLSLGSGGVKGLFVQHIEKIVFGVAILLVLAFVFLGYRLDSQLDGKTPDGLQSFGATAVANIERPTFEDVKKERTPREGQGGQYSARVDNDDPPDPDTYVIKPWDQPLGKPGSKREDPLVFAPTKLESTALIGPLCIRADEGEKGLLEDLENAPAPELKEKKEKKSRGRSGYPGYPARGEWAPVWVVKVARAPIHTAIWEWVWAWVRAEKWEAAVVVCIPAKVTPNAVTRRRINPAGPSVSIPRTKSVDIVHRVLAA